MKPSGSPLAGPLSLNLQTGPTYEMWLSRGAAISLLWAQAGLFLLGKSDWVDTWNWPEAVGYFWAGFWILLGGGIAIKPAWLSRRPGWIGIGTVALLLVALASWHAHDWAATQLIEMTLRWTAPLLWLGLATWPYT
ncbi:MAG: hypothetical protein AAFV07_05170, partial [Bacteroidota bacterium]